jgi:hypothetical protein
MDGKTDPYLYQLLNENTEAHRRCLARIDFIEIDERTFRAEMDRSNAILKHDLRKVKEAYGLYRYLQAFTGEVTGG